MPAFIWRDSGTGYGVVSVLLHWLAAVPVLVLIVLGLLMEWTIELDDDVLYGRIKFLHLSTGAVLAAIVVPRIGWRLWSGWPVRRPERRALNLAAPTVWRLLLAGLLVQTLTGVLARFTARDWPGTGATPLPVFALFEIPSPFDAHRPWLNGVCENVHDWCADILLVLVAMHVIGALAKRLRRSQW